MRAKAIIAVLCIIMHICACSTITDDPLSDGIESEFMEEVKSEPFFEEIKDYAALSQSIQKTELMLRKVTGGIPLVLPLVEFSDPSLFLIPVAYDSTTLTVQRLYLLDSNPMDLDYTTDLYLVDTLYYVNDEENPYRVVVTRGEYRKCYNINGYQFHNIRKINKKSGNALIQEVRIYNGSSQLNVNNQNNEAAIE